MLAATGGESSLIVSPPGGPAKHRTSGSLGLDLRGEVAVRKKVSRTQLLRFTSNIHVELIGIEACRRSHFPGQALREQGHEVRLIPAQYVATAHETVFESKCVVGTSHIAHAPQRRMARPGRRKLLNLLIGVGPFSFSGQHPPPSTQSPIPSIAG